jgi:hypothetical protein
MDEEESPMPSQSTHRNYANKNHEETKRTKFFLLFAFFVSSWFLFPEESFRSLSDPLKQ